MNRNKKGVMPEITRGTYKSVKKYDRQQFTVFCVNLYKYGYEDGRESVPGIDVADIMDAISRVKGIGAKKMESIRVAIESTYQVKEHRKALEDLSVEEVVIQKHSSIGKTDQLLEILDILPGRGEGREE